MKYLLLFFSLMFLPGSQEVSYHVTYISKPNSVKITNTKRFLKIGDVLRLSDRLTFTDSKAVISCLSTKLGHFEIRVNGNTLPKRGFWAKVGNILFPDTESYSFDTRAEPGGNDPRSYFNSAQTQQRILLIQGKPVTIINAYPLSGQNFFFLQYKIGGDDVVKKIRNTGQQIFIDDALPVEADGTTVVLLGYQSKDGDGNTQTEKIAEFKPVLLAADRLASTIGVIRNMAANSSKEEQEALIMNCIYRYYGKIGKDELFGR